MYDGTCFAEHVGVNAPGRPKIAIVLPLTRSSTLNVFGPIVQPLPSTSMNSDNVPEGSLSPTWIMVFAPCSLVFCEERPPLAIDRGAPSGREDCSPDDRQARPGDRRPRS